VTEATPLAESAGLAVLVAKMAATAAFVICVALLSERVGPFLGAMTASLPIYTGPIYLFLALDHGPDYLAQSLIGSTAISAATPIFALTYCLLALRFGVGASLGGALLAWGLAALAIRSHAWTQVQAALLTTAVFVVAVPVSGYFKHAGIIVQAQKRWIDLPLRAMLVAATVGVVTIVSAHTPPMVTGILTVVPVIFSSLILVLHPRIGGRATAALMAHSISGLIGMVIAFIVAELTIRRIGTAPALLIGLGICIAWNLMLIVARHGLGWLRR
jgi:hypothetical protein